MSFSATVRGTALLGGSGIKMTYGEWTGNAGDAAGTLSVSGNVIQAVFQKFDALDNTYEIVPRIEVTQSGFVSTVTVENQDNVTTGKFVILSLGL